MKEIWSFRFRVYHWMLALFITIEYFSDDDQLMWIHEWVGYGIGLLVLFRLYIGVTGKQYELFKNTFMFKKQTISNWYGHNIPASYVLAFMQFLILIITFSGMLLLGAKEFEGVFVMLLIDIDVSVSDFIALVHTKTTDILLVLIGTHIAGVSIDHFIHKSKVINSIITGYKELK